MLDPTPRWQAAIHRQRQVLLMVGRYVEESQPVPSDVTAELAALSAEIGKLAAAVRGVQATLSKLA